ncbi:hypothetical protein SAMN02745673_00804 [Marinactinospora thermotolerans DSM 45154]|uniref:Uncharacterized protein n=2 Tax=Marinactinospora thermotolerans TaxID=531310 RepID=A0A1T4LS97_9ACTN|nr:hypothetical protein [Marinactinospora thermotolerans]SJZ57619.1 hypothetical protein SAMN02745673_00804 [Marinactinospora thermotolerans DSM 45154]
MPPLGPLLRFLDVAPWAAATALGIFAAAGLVIAVSEFRRSQNTRLRRNYFEKGEIPKRKKFLLFGAETREMKYVPGTKIPLSEMRPQAVEKFRDEIVTGRDRADEMELLGHKGGFVPSERVAALREQIQGEENKLAPERAALLPLQDENRKLEQLAARVEEEGRPYQDIAQRAAELQRRVNNEVKRVTSDIKRGGDALKQVTDQVKADPRVVKLEKTAGEEREGAALAGFDLEKAVKKRLGSAGEPRNQGNRSRLTGWHNKGGSSRGKK